MNAEQYLQRVKILDDALSLKKLEEERLLGQAVLSTASPLGSERQSGGGRGKLEASGKAELRAKKAAETAKNEFERCRQKAILLLEKLPDPLQYGALYRHYILYMPWEKVAQNMGLSLRHIYRIKGRALEILNRKFKKMSSNVI